MIAHDDAPQRSRGHGLTQAGRRIAALDPESAPVDQRSPAYFLAFAGELARLLNFYEPTGAVSGDWQPFIDADVSFLLADICTVRDEDELQASGALLRRMRWQGAQEGALRDVVDHVHRVLRRFDDWLARASRLDAQDLAPAAAGPQEHTNVALYLGNLVHEHLRWHVDAILAHEDWRACWRAAERGDAAQHGSAGHARAGQHGPWYRRPPWAVADGEARAHGGHATLAQILAQLNSAVRELKAFAAAALERSLADDATHPPHTTLYIAFVHLLQVLGKDLNRFTGRHLDYYYRDVLQLREREGSPDRGVAAFRLVPAVSGYFLPRGTQLSAGKDAAGNPVLYATDADVLLNQGRVASLRTLYLARAPSGRVVQAFAAPRADTADGLGKPLADPATGWRLFGYVREQEYSRAAPLQARFGMLVASPVLALSQGRRRVSLRFTFGRAGVDAMLAAGTVQGPWRRAVRDSLAIAASGAKGWIDVPDFYVRSVTADAATASAELVFTLGADQPSVVANPALDDAGDGTLPVLRLLLRPGARLYGAVTGLVLEQVDIRADVCGMTDVKISAPGTAGKPFAPFGLGLPGASVDVSHPELAAAQLQWAHVELDWANLPATPADFARYYAGYGPGFDAGGFALRVYQRRARQWTQVRRDVPLIGARHARTRLSFQAPPEAPSHATDGDPAAGAVRIALVAPPDGFGVHVYPRAFANCALRNAAHLANRDKPEDMEPVPNPPLVPMVQAVRCAYRAGERIALLGPAGAPRLFALHPFGARALPQDRRTPLFEDDGYDGRLFIGLAGLVPPQALSLHFELRAQAAPVVSVASGGAAQADASAVSWRYLAADEWREFATYQVQATMAGLSSSGIVTFQLPRELNDDNRLMPGGLFWLEARVKGTQADSVAVAIVPQAVGVTRCAGAAVASVAAGTIQGMVKKPAQVAGVLQPYPTSGGSVAESTAQFRDRVCERLKHRQRASQPDDFERLVLAGFPGVRQAKCITFNNSRGYAQAGRVRAGEVVVALVQAGTDGVRPAPAPRWLLAAVAALLQARAAPAVRNISVRNCAYEEIKVFANIEFVPGHDANTGLQQLGDAISRELAPWLYDAAQALPLGCGRVDVGRLAHVIRSQPYVANTSAIHIGHACADDGGDGVVNRIGESGTAWASTPWSVLVPAARHELWIGSVDAGPHMGIGSLAIDDDLIVTRGEPRVKAALAAAGTHHVLEFPVAGEGTA